LKMARILFVACVVLLFSVSFGKPRWHELEDYSFEEYSRDFNRVYDRSEGSLRRVIFEARLAEIKEHNSNPHHTWKKGVNHFTDQTDQELSSLRGYDKHLGFSQKSKRVAQPSSLEHLASISLGDLPTHVDWREKGVVTPVKDQGRCGSCWTFGAAQGLESHYAIKQGLLVELSEQMILDCVPNPQGCGGTGGCSGGTVELVYDTLINKGWKGLPSEWTYPYRSHFGQPFSCNFNSSSLTPLAASISTYVVLPINEYDPVIKALATVGPLTISVDAGNWHAYETGVFNGCNQTNPDIDHSVQLVGYGTDDKLGDYWLVRNSWTPAWGEAGYIRLPRSSKVECGIDTTPEDGTGCAGSPPQTVCGACGILFDVVYPAV